MRAKDEKCLYVPGLRRKIGGFAIPKVLPTEEARIIRDEVKKRVEDTIVFDGLVDLP